MGIKDIRAEVIEAAVHAGSFPVMQWMEERNTRAYAHEPLPTPSSIIPARIASMAPMRGNNLIRYDKNVADSAKVRAGVIGSHQRLLAKYPKIAKLFSDMPCNCTFY